MSLAVVVVCHDSAPDLVRTLTAVRGQFGPDDELVVVDNASSDGTPAVARRAAPEATVLETGANLGFAGGGQRRRGRLLGAAAPVPQPRRGAGARLPGGAARLRRRGAGVGRQAGAGENGRRPPRQHRRQRGHFLGFGWAGRCGEPVDVVGERPEPVGFASGAALLVRREARDAAGRFDERYFMYGEDLDLSLRLRLAGWGVGLELHAVVDHEYTFAKGAYKWFYLERNRWWTILGDYPGRLLVLVLPALLAFEIALLPVAWRGGWLAAKLRAQATVVRLLPAMLRRRRAVQAQRAIGEEAFAAALTASLDSPYLAAAARVPAIVALQAAYWRAVRRTLDDRRSRR